MDWFVIYVNGRPFAVTADSMESACETATIHLASELGAAVVEHSDIVAAWEND